MLERSHIQSTGFRNAGPAGARTGFELRLRQPNYRHTRLSLIEGIDLVVDGVPYLAERNRIRLGDREYSATAMRIETDVRWQAGTFLTVCVELPGGLAAGVHEVQSTIHFRHPYFPPRFRPMPVHDRRHVTLVMR